MNDRKKLVYTIISIVLVLVGIGILGFLATRSDEANIAEEVEAQPSATRIESTSKLQGEPIGMEAYLQEMQQIALEINNLFVDLAEWDNFKLSEHNAEGYEPYLNAARALHARLLSVNPPAQARDFHQDFVKTSETVLMHLEDLMLFYETGEDEYKQSFNEARAIIYAEQESFFEQIRQFYLGSGLATPTPR